MTPVPLWCADSGGSGVPVVLAHAIGCDHRMWHELAAELAPRYRVIAIDARGHGRSPVPPRPYTLEAMAADAAALLDRLGIARAHWIGLSMGGMVGQAFALSHPGRLDRLVLANTTSSYGAEGRALWQARARLVEDGGLAAIHDAVAQRYFSESFRRDHPAIVAGVMQRFLETPQAGYLGCCDAIAALDYSAELPRIGARTLVIAGAADAGTPPAMSEAIAAKIPRARLEVIPGAAHLSVAEKPREFAALVQGFLAEPGDA
jgi:3-oxoadipate enol-lactonase